MSQIATLTKRALLVMAATLVVAGVAFLAGSPAAQAQEVTCEEGTAAPPGGLCPDGSPPRDPAVDRQLDEYLRGADDRRHPPRVYDIGCDEGDWKSFMRKITCAAQAWPFAAGKWTVGVGSSIVSWAMDFSVAEALVPIAGLLSRVYDTSLIGPLGIRHLAWTATAVVGGWHMLRARTARGLSEIGSTFVIAVIGAFVIANPGGYLQGAVDAARNTSTAVLQAVGETVTGNDSDDHTVLLRDMLHQAFIAEPYDHINWGERLVGPCADARDRILDNGPWGTDGEPREIMREAGCDTHADFNEYPTDTRAVTSVVVAIAAFATVVLVVLVALGLLIAQLTLVLVFSLTSVVFAVAMFPGVARDVLWWWLRRIAWAVLAAVAAAFLMSWVAVSITAVLTTTEGLPLTQRALLVLLIAIFAWKVRGNLNRIGDTVSRRVGHHAARLTTANSDGGGGLAGAGAGNLRAMSRALATDLPGSQWAMYRLDARRYGHRGHSRLGRGRNGVARTAAAHTPGTLKATGGEIAAIGRAARWAALSPVLAPAAYAKAQRRVTNRSQKLRKRLDKARTTRTQWAHNASHPVQTMRDAHHQARSTTQPSTSPPTSGGASGFRRPDPPTRPNQQRADGASGRQAQPQPQGTSDTKPRRRPPRTEPRGNGTGRAWQVPPADPPGGSDRRTWRRNPRRSAPEGGPQPAPPADPPGVSDDRWWRRQAPNDPNQQGEQP